MPLLDSLIKAVLLGAAIGLVITMPVFILAIKAWKKRQAQYRSLERIKGIRVRYSGAKRFGKLLKLFPWEGVGIFSVHDGKATLTGLPLKNGGQFELTVESFNIMDYGKRSWFQNGLIPWIVLRHESGDIFICAETGSTIFGATKKHRELHGYLMRLADGR